MGRRILFVDDEKPILRSIERLFFDFDCELFTAESGEQALDILAKESMDIIVSDMRMPGMDGHQFLKQVKHLYPGTTRLILSGFSEEKSILDSLIDGSISLYLFKPWDSEELIRKIDQLLSARQIYENPALLELVNGMDNLRMVTGLYQSICELIDKEAEIGEIAKLIETDPAVTASILRIVNSAFFGVKTGSVTHAITFLGLRTIEQIILSCSLYNAVEIKVPPFNIQRLVHHANLTNIFVGKIYRDIYRKELPDQLNTAGLLHNLGLLMGIHYFPIKYSNIIAKLQHQWNEKSLVQLEKEVLGVSSSDFGGYLLSTWSIPYPIVECALFCHDPMNPAVMDRNAVAAVHVAAFYAWKHIDGNLAGKLDDRILDFLNVNEKTCDEVLGRLEEK